MSTKRRRLNPTTIFDPVHREYELPVAIVDIVNTEPFQRLRRLKQLGTAHWVWLGATHTRFEHSISVAYLAGYLTKSLQRKQPELGITDRQVLLVQLAGLLHDVGHGPFSHVFDDAFLVGVESRMAEHEARSNALVQQLLSAAGYIESEIAFVQSMIAPGPDDSGFFYEIVANHTTHLDVDKMEYVKRDTRACGLAQGGFDTDTMRILNAARVIDGHICYHRKVYDDIYNLFQTRYRLHTTVYRHPAVVAIQYMVTDALRASGLRLEREIEDMERFCKLDDTILDSIRVSPDMAEARALIRRIDTRDLYKVAATCKRSKPWPTPPTVEDMVVASAGALTAADIIVDVSCVGFTGKSDGHPMDHLRFYDGQKSYHIRRGTMSKLYSVRYCEYWTRIIVRHNSKLDAASRAWQAVKQCI